MTIPGTGDIGRCHRYRHGCANDTTTQVSLGIIRIRPGKVISTARPRIGMTNVTGHFVGVSQVLAISIRPGTPVRRIPVTAGTASDDCTRRIGYMAVGTGRTDRTGPAKSRMANAASRRTDICGRVPPIDIVPVDVIPASGRRVGSEVIMTILTAVGKLADRYIETGVASCAVGVTALTSGQVELCVLAMFCRRTVTAINRVRSGLRATGVTTGRQPVGIGMVG